jgi:glycosyltransferase involved in cell wall biosynthesis
VTQATGSRAHEPSGSGPHRVDDRPVALFIPALDGGGGERITLLLAAELQAAGHDVDLVVGSSRGPLLAEVPAGVPLVDLGCEHLRAGLPPLVRYLRGRRPGWLLPTIEHASVLAIAAAAVARSDTKVMVRVANTLSHDQAEAPTVFERFTGVLVRRLYRRANVLVACSNGMADDLAVVAGVDRRTIHVVPNPAIGHDLQERAREPLSHPWFRPGAPPVILAVGRLTAQKNYALLLGAFALLRHEREARLIILGEGPEREALQQRAHALHVDDDVDLPGFDPNPYRYMARANVVALSSDWEGLPGVLIEALACGVSVVATDCPSGPREILRDGEYGRLVPVGDVDRFATALGDAIDDPRRAPAAAWEPFTVRNSAALYARLLQDPSHADAA